MFKWDGSRVDLTDCKIEEAVQHDYWRIKFKNGQREVCLVKPSPHDAVPCLIDETKRLFNLEKVGTHWTIYNDKSYVLLRVKLNEEGSIILDATLNTLNKYNQHIANEIKKIFAFREMMGVSKTNESSVILRMEKYKGKEYVTPISFLEFKMEPAKEKIVIPKTVMDKWFINVSYDENEKEVRKDLRTVDVILDMLKIKKPEEISSVLFNLRYEFEKIVERVDRNNITFVDEVIERIGNYLQYGI